MMQFIFWLSVTMILYTYAGYPLLLWLASRFFAKPVKKGRYEPRVSVILSAFNEERFIEKKLLNLLDIDYPEDKVEILIGSDGGKDETDTIVSKFLSNRIRFFRFVNNLGKPHVLNALVKEAHGTILVFTDARQEFERGTIRELVENFQDPEVGCVSGELLFKSTDASGVGSGMDAYWRYEKFMRKCESDLGSMLGATGAIYAIRRQFYTPVPNEVLVDDMYIPLAIIRKGYRAVFDPQPKAYDHVSTAAKQEYTRKIRTLAGNWQIFKAFSDLMIPFRSPIAFQLISHKFLRLTIPFFMILAFASNLLLMAHPIYMIAFALQAAFYVLALAEWMGERSQKRRPRGIGYIPYTFCVLNYSALVSFFYYITKRHLGTWRKAYA